MITSTIFPGKYIQGSGAINRLGKLIPRYGTKGFLICSPSAFETILPSLKSSLEDTVPVIAERFGRECTDEEITRLSDLAQREACDVIVGIGGGKTLDTAKAVSHGLGCPVLLVPTIASTDAPCSAISVIYRSTGQVKRVISLVRNPDVVLVDTDIIARSPVRLLVAGMGDALATWFEAESCMLKPARNMAGGYGSAAVFTLARLCYDQLLQYGVEAKDACEAGMVTPALEQITEANILLSGLGFESGGLGAAHAIHDGFTALEQCHDYYHGEKVAFGLLASLFLTGKPKEIVDEVYSFCESVGLPSTFADIGLDGVSDDDLQKVARIACGAKESIHNELAPVTPEAVVASLKEADAEGTRRKH
ncbi:MAG TPA: glycerol dehydrogenase [Deltaproteobacteria bacterium]|nr:glycerol dehydrogenase [Deltaproteobacteria bacterium]